MSRQEVESLLGDGANLTDGQWAMIESKRTEPGFDFSVRRVDVNLFGDLGRRMAADLERRILKSYGVEEADEPIRVDARGGEER